MQRDTKIKLQNTLREYGNKYENVNIFIDGMNHYIRSFVTTYGLIYSPQNEDISSFYYSIKHLALLNKLFKQTFKNHQMYIITEHGKSSRMKDILTEYKLNRKYKTALGVEEEEKKERFHKNLKLFRDFTELLSPKVKTFNVEKIEGDFVISYLYFNLRNPSNTLNVIISTDKDFYQLLKYPDIIILNPQYNKIITSENMNRYLKSENLNPQNILPFKILIGDKSDNIEGVTGPKTAEKIIKMLEKENDDIIDSIDKVIKYTKVFLNTNKKHYKVFDKIIAKEDYLKKVNEIVNLDESNIIDIIDNQNLIKILSILKNKNDKINYKDINDFLNELNIDSELVMLIHRYLVN